MPVRQAVHLPAQPRRSPCWAVDSCWGALPASSPRAGADRSVRSGHGRRPAIAVVAATGLGIAGAVMIATGGGHLADRGGHRAVAVGTPNWGEPAGAATARAASNR